MTSSSAVTRIHSALTALAAVVLLVMTAGTAVADPEPSPTDTAAASLATVELTAAAASSNVSTGGLVIIEGELAVEGGAPVSGVRIAVMLDDEESPDSLVMTDEGGVFKTFTEIPSELPPGEVSLVVAFAGNENYAAARQEIDVTVQEIPLAERSSSENSPAINEAAAVYPSVDASATAGDENAAADEADGESSPWSWFYVTLVVVGGAALLITAGLVFRGIYGRSGESVPRRPGSLDILLEEAQVDGDEPDVDTVGASDAEVAPDTDGAAEPGGAPRPRRGVE